MTTTATEEPATSPVVAGRRAYTLEMACQLLFQLIGGTSIPFGALNLGPIHSGTPGVRGSPRPKLDATEILFGKISARDSNGILEIENWNFKIESNPWIRTIPRNPWRVVHSTCLPHAITGATKLITRVQPVPPQTSDDRTPPRLQKKEKIEWSELRVNRSRLEPSSVESSMVGSAANDPTLFEKGCSRSTPV